MLGWNNPPQRLEKDHRVYMCLGHACAHNLRSIVEPDKVLHKPHGWMTTHPEIAPFLEQKWPGQDAKHVHRPDEGSDTKHSGSYTSDLPEGIMRSFGHADLSSLRCLSLTQWVKCGTIGLPPLQEHPAGKM